MRLQRHSNGERIGVSPSDLVGTGGEARVYLVQPDRRFVAKIYHRPTEAQCRKLHVMLANPPEDPTSEQAHSSIAWPVDLLSMAHGERRFAGYLMPRVTDMRPLFQVYNPSIRRQGPRFVDYLFLHRAARNMAAAVRALHGRGYIVGDINESNILVGQSALVTLVDTDSFQVTGPTEKATFRCPVGKAEYTPPELQKVRFTAIDRTAEHDRFGLAVLIFQMLMEGTHPFAGLYTGSGDPPSIETRIANGHFAYGNPNGPFRPGPIAPPFELLDPTLRHLFLRCFEDGHIHPAARPDALTWQNALAQAERQLTKCTQNPLHKYGAHLPKCPWCERAALLDGRDPFPQSADSAAIPMKRVKASSLLPAAASIPAAGPSSSSSGGAIPAPPMPASQSWQASQPLSASLGSGAATSLPAPTLFTFRMNGTGWAWGAFFWAALAVASAPLGLPGLNWMTALSSVACALFGVLAKPRMAGIGRWVSTGSALCACLSLALRPLTVAPLAGGAALSAGTGAVRSLSFSPDGRRLASGTNRMEDASLTEGAVNLWDAETNQLLLTPERASGDVVSVAFSPDGGSLAVATDSPFGTGEVVLVSASSSGAYQSVFKQRRHMRQVAWSPDGSYLASAGAERFARIWDAHSLQPLHVLELSGYASVLAFSPEGSRIAVGSGASEGSVASGYVSVFETSTGHRLWSQAAHGNGVQALAFAPDGNTLATAGHDGAVCLWNSERGRLVIRQTTHSYGIAALAFARDGKQFATAESRQAETGIVHEIVLRDASTGAPLQTLSGSVEAITALAYSPKGGLLASGSKDGTIRLWRLAAK